MTTETVIPGATCKRCGHSWLRRMPEAPRICPKCKSPYWNVERRQTQEGSKP